MELQQTSSRRSRPSTSRPPRPVLGWTPLEFSRVVSVGMVLAAPWYFASAPWSAQYWIVWGAIALVFLLVGEYLRRLWFRQDTGKLAIPLFAGIFLGLAGFGWFQSLPLFSVSSDSRWVPPSVQLQRWFLGYSNVELDRRFETSANVPPLPIGITPPHDWLEDANIALSVEPLHTRAAVGGMAVVAVMVWVGATAFSTRRSQIALLTVLTLLGVCFALLGVAHVLSWEKVNWLGLDSSNSFATFVSRNTAGGFMNICLAASFGLSAWAFGSRNSQEKQRYAYVNESPGLRLLHSAEDVFAQLTTLQIAVLLATASILIGVICTGSRGAAVSSVLACVVALLAITNRRSRKGVWLFAFFVGLIAVSAMMFFQLDDRVTARFSELASEEGLKTEIQVGRIYIWSVALRAFLFFGMLGSGLGTFHYAHLPFQKPTGLGWYYHAESLYAQALVELGWIGLAAIVTLVVLAGLAIYQLSSVKARTSTRHREGPDLTQPIYLTGLALATSQATHSIADFAMIVPAVFLPAGLLFGMVLGAARRKRRSEKGVTGESVEPVSPSHRKPLPKIEGDRFASLVPPPPVVAPTTTPIATNHTAFVGGLLVSFFCLFSSLSPIDALLRVDRMNRWLKDQASVETHSRLSSPSAYLAGLWANPILPFFQEPIFRVPDALRMIGESVLFEYRTQRLDETEWDPAEKASIRWEKTSPLLIRLAAFEREAEAKSKNSDVVYEKTAEFMELMGGEKQYSRWQKAEELIERAHLQSPLDWRLLWGRLLLDRSLSIQEWNGWFDRSSLILAHRPDTLFQLGVLGWQAAKDRQRSYQIWAQSMQLAPWLATRAGPIIAMETKDEDVPTEIFPDNPYYLSVVAANPFDEKRFPKTNKRLWTRLGELAEALPVKDPNRLFWLASVAAHFGNTSKELEYLAESVNRNPMDRQLRLKFADRLSASGDYAGAIEHTEVCQSMAPNDPQIEANLERLRKLAAEAKRKK